MMQSHEGRELEEGFGIMFTDEILMEPESVAMKELKKTVRKASQEKLLLKCEEKTPLIFELGRMNV